MRIVQFVPGTGNFYCGMCIRDHALARSLRRLGHDVVTAPLYLPLVVEEAADMGSQPLFFGGVNVFLQQKSRFFCAAPRWLDRWLDAPVLLRWLADHWGMTRPADLGEMTVSMLRGDEGRHVKELNRMIAWLTNRSRPDIVYLATALLVGLAGPIKAELGVPVVCTLQGEDKFLDSLPHPFKNQAWQMLTRRAAEVDVFLPVSGYYGRLMADRLSLRKDQWHTVPNGIDLDGLEPVPAAPAQPVLGYLAHMSCEKGLGTLIDAYLLLRRRGRVEDVKLRVAGAMRRSDRPFVRSLCSRLASAGLAGHSEFLPNIDRATKTTFLQSLSVFSVPATYGESFGLYVLEALACGVPVVQPRHAAFPELLAATGGGILCEPNDVQALAEAIESVLLDHKRARAEAARARDIVIDKFNADRMARDVADWLIRIVP